MTKSYKTIMIIAFVFVIAFLCIGYAALTDTLIIDGNADSAVQEDVFIYLVTADESGNNVVKDCRYFQTTLNFTLDATNTSETVYVSFFNSNPSQAFYYWELIKDSVTVADNQNVSVTVEEMEQYDVIEANQSGATNTLKAKVTFSRIGSITETLNPVIAFDFSEYSAIFPDYDTDNQTNWFDLKNESTVTRPQVSKIVIKNIPYTDISSATNSNVTYVENGSTVMVDPVLAWTISKEVVRGETVSTIIAYATGSANNYTVTIVGGDKHGELFMHNMDRFFACPNDCGGNSITCANNSFKRLTTIDGLQNINTSHCTNMFGLFRYAEALTEVDMSALDLAKVTEVAHMFNGCKALKRVNLESFVDCKMTSLSGFFQHCDVLYTTFKWVNGTAVEDGRIDLSHFDTSECTKMYAMFHHCYYAVKIDFNGPNVITSKVVGTSSDTAADGMAAMFQHCIRLQEVDLRCFDTRYTRTMRQMFACTNEFPVLATVKYYTGVNWDVDATTADGKYRSVINFWTYDNSYRGRQQMANGTPSWEA